MNSAEKEAELEKGNQALEDLGIKGVADAVAAAIAAMSKRHDDDNVKNKAHRTKLTHAFVNRVVTLAVAAGVDEVYLLELTMQILSEVHASSIKRRNDIRNKLNEPET
ncbi:TPA: hypothetical protein DD449_03260 [Candidatus Berkelbacteria bacterium]|uniref:Uncharacterized protein n=1 Tax=Berkelbacteria bacterium GW2011_GWE1_39_12 TaxID=1618337 RepID=A0A0G4B3U0_9BACT|nr:MAG: hypothetical protein UT28_C0001G0282 [Berkelbacteria bacterium GW2011_GWE1_39_12]HBO60677.1 hypothetical protein [Candidatus Berkelbacteria bacterium]